MGAARPEPCQKMSRSRGLGFTVRSWEFAIITPLNRQVMARSFLFLTQMSSSSPIPHENSCRYSISTSPNIAEYGALVISPIEFTIEITYPRNIHPQRGRKHGKHEHFLEFDVPLIEFSKHVPKSKISRNTGRKFHTLQTGKLT